MPKKSTGRGRGRPAHKPSDAQRRDVSIAAGGGMPHEEIAIAMGIGVDTLRKYYEAELSVGANVRRMEALKGLHKAAKRGSSSAAKAYLAATPQVAAPPAPPTQPDPPPAAEQPKLGKKEQADADAKTAHRDTDWAELLEPKTTIQ
jgi:hypothetical protein